MTDFEGTHVGFRGFLLQQYRGDHHRRNSKFTDYTPTMRRENDRNSIDITNWLSI
jgi:hypothetical protein